MLPGPGATQLAIFIGHAKGGIAGGILAGVCFIAPAFAIMLALAGAYVAFGTLPAMRSAFYGIGPVVVGIFAVAIYRLGRATIKDAWQIAIAAVTLAVTLWTPLGLVATLLAAGCAGVALFYSRRTGLIALLVLAAGFAALYLAGLIATPLDLPGPDAGPRAARSAPALWEIATFFFKIGAFTFGGGLSMLAFIQEQVVNQLAWLTPREFVDGLALGQLTPGPILMLAAFIGFKLLGVAGAAIAVAAIFLPSFLMILSVLPVLRRTQDLQWLKAFMRGVGPSVIGALAVSLVQMAPRALPDPVTWCILAIAVAIMLGRKLGSLPLMVGGGAIGLLSRGRAWELILGLVK
jgi:chromate transporter